MRIDQDLQPAVELAVTGEAPRLGQFKERDLIAERYLVHELVAIGGMGEVYKVEHVELGKVLAFKVIRAELSDDEAFTNRFRLEALAASRIVHPNVVGVSDFGQLSDGRSYFVMEYVEGVTLLELLREEGALPAERVVAIGLQVARGLQAAHELGIVHRDLKPANVLVVPQVEGPECVKVLDFGIARVNVDGRSLGRTSIGIVLGTSGYMAPEQIRADAAIDGRTDIYALGIILHELLTGVAVFSGDSDSDLMLKAVYEEPPALVDVPPPLAALVAQMLAKSAADRPQSMREVAERLLDWNDDTVDTVDQPAELVPPLEPPAPRGRGWLVFALVLLALIGAASAVLVVGPVTPHSVVVVKVPSASGLAGGEGRATVPSSEHGDAHAAAFVGSSEGVVGAARIEARDTAVAAHETGAERATETGDSPRSTERAAGETADVERATETGGSPRSTERAAGAGETADVERATETGGSPRSTERAAGVGETADVERAAGVGETADAERAAGVEETADVERAAETGESLRSRRAQRGAETGETPAAGIPGRANTGANMAERAPTRSLATTKKRGTSSRPSDLKPLPF